MAVNTVKIITLNCQGLRSDSSRETLFAWLNCFRPDIVCLQETNSISEAEFDSWIEDMNRGCLTTISYSVVSSPGTAPSSGFATLFNSSFTLESVSPDTDGRCVIATLNHGSSLFQVGNIYGPNNKHDGIPFFESLIPGLEPDTPLFSVVTLILSWTPMSIGLVAIPLLIGRIIPLCLLLIC